MNPQEDKSHDVVVVGAGVIGLACAWRAAQRGMKVVVLDRDQPGSGASRVAAGMLSPVGEASWGEENLLDLNLASMERWPGFAEELAAESGVEVGFRPCGALHVALDRDEASELQRRHRLHLELGLESEWLRSSECRRLEPGLAPPVAGGVHARHEAGADPRLLVPALAAAVKAAGGSIETGMEVTAAEVEAGTIMGVRAADGRRFRAGAVVLAAGCWSGAAEWLPAEARPSVRPVKGEILTLRTDPSEPICERIVATERVYVVPRGDGRLVVGATVEERGFDTTVTAGGVHELLREAYRALPDVAEAELAEVTAGLRPGTPDNAPLIGPGALDGLVVASGHFRNGILLAPITGDLVATVLGGEEPAVDIRPFDPARFAGLGARAAEATAP